MTEPSALEILRNAKPEVARILAGAPGDPDATHRDVTAARTTRLLWRYDESRPQLTSLYRKATQGQWDADRDLDWSIEVDPNAAQVMVDDSLRALAGTGRRSPFAGWTDQDWAHFGAEMQRYTISQFLHGEQLALVGTAKIVETAPDLDARMFAASQVGDEARHVEVFSRYVHDKLGGSYPINSHFAALFDDIVTDSRWDFTYLGVQVMVEGLALSAFSYLQRVTKEPLLKTMLRYVVADEARHVAFGVLALRDLYPQLTEAELRDRQEFVFEAALALRNRLIARDVFEQLDLPVERLVRGSLIAPAQREMRRDLFARIVPICRQLGLLDAGDGWLRDRFADLGVIGYADDPVETADLPGALDTRP